MTESKAFLLFEFKVSDGTNECASECNTKKLRKNGLKERGKENW